MAKITENDPEEVSSHRAMYLQSLKISNFRSCIDTAVSLQADITILVGENNAGKSNIIEALRLATSPLSRRRTRYFEADDVTESAPDSPIVITTQYAQLSEFQKAHYIGALDLTDDTATYVTRYSHDRDNPRKSRVESLAGKVGLPDSEPEKREQINHVYLAPLRDANRELDSAGGNRLALVMETLLESDIRDDFMEKAEDKYDELEKHDAVTTTNSKLQSELTRLTDGVRKQYVSVAFDKMKLGRLTRSLRLKMNEHSVDPSDLANSGLGYANLLFLASVVLELSSVHESELTLFLVEEPEAHLHPQLQAVLLDYLRDQARRSVTSDDSGPAGRIQVIATTHSPNLASSAGLDPIVVVQTDTADIATGNADAPRGTKTLPLAQISFGEEPECLKAKRKINQYLDVTRAELLFARRVILVEGIAEQLIIPALAKNLVLKDDQERQRKFRGVTLINIGSVDFEPYLRLLLQEINGCRLIESLVVVTDADPLVPKSNADTEPDVDAGTEVEVEYGDSKPSTEDAEGDIEDEEGDEAVVYNRASDLLKVVAELGAESLVHIAEAPHTLEADLLEPAAKNKDVFSRAFLAQKTRSRSTIESIASSANPSQAFYERLYSNKKFISKGQFAHDFALELSDPGDYVCPPYLAKAIRFAIGEPLEPGK